MRKADGILHQACLGTLKRIIKYLLNQLLFDEKSLEFEEVRFLKRLLALMQVDDQAYLL